MMQTTEPSQVALPCIAQVVVELPLDGPFDYRIPPALQAYCAVGQRVLVPLGQRQVLGYIIGLVAKSSIADLKELGEILDDEPLLTRPLLELTRWVAEYYLCPWGLVLKAAVPEGFRVQTTAVYSLAEGAREQVWPGGKAGEVLQCLSQRGTLRQRELEQLLDNDQLHTLLRRLRRQGLIGQEQQRRPPTIRQRMITMVRLTVSPAKARALQEQSQKRAPNQAAVLAFLQEQEEWELPILTQRLAGAAAAIKRLASQQVVEIVKVEQKRTVVTAPPLIVPKPPVLNQAQQHALVHIETKMAMPDGQPILLHGVTGSGKTEVYMRAIAAALREGKSALVLVPEIALTEQLIERFVGRFGTGIAVLHSGLSGGERFDEWRRVAEGEARIAIGARSAVFAPLQNLGLIIIDEEHEASYKQEEAPRYNARDVAVVRAQQCQAVVILGSATPALETFYNARNGKYLALSLPYRVEDKPLPEITVVDQRLHATPNERVITTPLFQAIEACLQRHEQCLILINRRGFAAFLQCHACGTVPSCPHCSVSLTYHKRDRTLRCHYCSFTQPAPSHCLLCNSAALRPHGLGTQQVESTLAALFPAARLARMDRDTTRGKQAHQQILRSLARGDIDILVGTQMIAKGHDYPNITLVGVVSADATLAIPDFRAPERLFQLLTQVAGRAGRGSVPGQVLIQTYRPEHYSIGFARQHDFLRFFQEELQRRQAMLYSPYTRLARIILDGLESERVREVSLWVGNMLQNHFAQRTDVFLLGPAEAPLAKINDHYRWHLLLRAPSSRTLHACLATGLRSVHRERQRLQRVRLSVDIDPLTFL